ncbi:hypothetical protein R6Q57_003375 [Mikania cordata]
MNDNGTTAAAAKIVINGGQSPAVEISPVGPSEIALKQTVGPSIYWSRDEQSLLEELIVKYASDNMVMRYAKIALKLQNKTLKDVALRCRWMTEKEKRKQGKKKQEKKEEAASEQVKSPSTNHSSGECIDEEISCRVVTVGAAAAQLLEQSDHTINQVSANAYVFKTLGKAAYQQVKPSSHSTNDSSGLHHADSDEDMDDDISYKAIGGAAARLLEQNDQAINQILANVSANKLHENIVLESQTRNNLNILLNEYPKQKQGIKLSIVTVERPTAEAAERVSLEKANMEAWLEAERAAAQRVQTEARERKKARHRAERAAVEREVAEARNRAAVERAVAEARNRAAAEARERANMEARLKAERIAVHRAQMEACKRPRDRVEQTAPDAQEKEAQEKERVAAKAQTEARRRAERAAVERAAAEARKRAATEACKRASMEARLKAERVAMQRAQMEARERPRERAEQTAA